MTDTMSRGGEVLLEPADSELSPTMTPRVGCYKHSRAEQCRAARGRHIIVGCAAVGLAAATFFDLNNTHILGVAAHERPQAEIVDDARSRLTDALGEMSAPNQFRELYVLPEQDSGLSVVVPRYVDGTRVVGAATRGAETIGLRARGCLVGVVQAGEAQLGPDGFMRVPLADGVGAGASPQASSGAQWLVFNQPVKGNVIEPADSATSAVLAKYGCATTVVPDFPARS